MNMTANQKGIAEMKHKNTILNSKQYKTYFKQIKGIFFPIVQSNMEIRDNLRKELSDNDNNSDITNERDDR